MHKIKASIITLGCRVNQYESDAIMQELSKSGVKICSSNEIFYYDTVKYKFSGIGTTGMQYATYRTVANYANLNSFEILLCGDTAKTAQIGTITAYTHTEAPVKNPTITVGSDSITFNCTIQGGEYIEYDPLTGKATLYHNGLLPENQTTEEITFSGKLNISSPD